MLRQKDAPPPPPEVDRRVKARSDEVQQARWNDDARGGAQPSLQPLELSSQAALELVREETPPPAPQPEVEWRHASTFNKRETDKVYKEFGGGVFGTQGQLLAHQSVRNARNSSHNESPPNPLSQEPFDTQQPRASVRMGSMY
eukprot:TRINITY_DN17598_c0_g1_i1.p1 TRINITY_DN17598_c0_g1~~TRINITY_DN17598_c0_g1_i1.p1  ORF type:complete len:143 (+),score=19.18 TRINITY_DN17598_c0_g1_i1:559-987(+)